MRVGDLGRAPVQFVWQGREDRRVCMYVGVTGVYVCM
jgi:hypothetical protein